MPSSEDVWGHVFIAPWLVGFIVFTLGPFVVSFYLSFTKYELYGMPIWVGLRNYSMLFNGLLHRGGDSTIAVAFFNTVYYTVFSVPAGLALAFALAMLLNAKVRGRAVLRTMFYIPSITPAVASAILWLWLLNPTYGLVNLLLRTVFGIESGPQWFSSTTWAKPALIIMSLWTVGNTVVIYLAGLQGVPDTLYEAAAIDGANRWGMFRHVTVPQMTPSIFFTLVLGLIGSFQVFTPALVITNGGPADATLFYLLHLYRNGFQYFKMGYASAMAWFLFVIMVTLTVLQFRMARNWVYYEGEA
ncbi:MAG: carbohydrate ABC transporter permease [Anaerolineae bacterium]